MFFATALHVAILREWRCGIGSGTAEDAAQIGIRSLSGRLRVVTTTSHFYEQSSHERVALTQARQTVHLSRSRNVDDTSSARWAASVHGETAIRSTSVCGVSSLHKYETRTAETSVYFLSPRPANRLGSICRKSIPALWIYTDCRSAEAQLYIGNF